MIGVVDVGGGLRGVYGAGVFDYCLDRHIHFDYGIGVSAGSANIISYLGGQKGRNYTFYMDYSFRKQYMSAGNFLKTGSYLDMDYIYGELSVANGENPLNYPAVAQSDSIFKVVSTNALTGQTIYFDKSDLAQDDYRILMASSSIPVLCRPYRIGDLYCFDGGIGDPVPVKKAFADGCDRVVVILTNPVDLVRDPKKDRFPAALLARKYPHAAQQLRIRAQKYNDGVALARHYEQQGKVLIVAPDDCCGIKMLTKNKDSIDAMYRKGYRDAEKIKDFVEQ